MPAVRHGYNTRQRQAVFDFLSRHADHYLSVDDVFGSLREEGSKVGRTTAYRTLEALTRDGAVAKVVSPGGGESRYRLIDPERPDEGQLVCLGCGKVLALDCHMLDDLHEHVRSDHGFAIEFSRTVLYGYCDDCQAGRDGGACSAVGDGPSPDGSSRAGVPSLGESGAHA